MLMLLVFLTIAAEEPSLDNMYRIIGRPSEYMSRQVRFCGYKSPSSEADGKVVILAGRTGWDSLYVDISTTYQGKDGTLCAKGVFQRADRMTQQQAHALGRVYVIHHAPNPSYIVRKQDHTIYPAPPP